MRSIVVGVDESSGAAEALRWAAREGQLHECRVTAVLCWGYLDQHHGTPGGPFDPAYSRLDARAAVDAIVEGALSEGAASIERRTVNDLPARGLVESSAEADLLVVGARGLGTLRDLLLGSVSQACLHRTRIATAVVRTTGVRRPTGRERVVVGVDGSETAQRALNWALDEARRWQAAVEVVHAWTPPLLADPTLAYGYGPFEEVARFILDAALDKADTSNLPVPVRRTIRTGSGGHVLVDAAKDADLVVVGSRGLGGFKGLLLGSVSHQITHHSPCPVVVIPHHDEGD